MSLEGRRARPPDTMTVAATIFNSLFWPCPKAAFEGAAVRHRVPDVLLLVTVLFRSPPTSRRALWKAHLHEILLSEIFQVLTTPELPQSAGVEARLPSRFLVGEFICVVLVASD